MNMARGFMESFLFSLFLIVMGVGLAPHGAQASAEEPHSMAYRIVGHWDPATTPPPFEAWRAMGIRDLLYYVHCPITVAVDGSVDWNSPAARDAFLRPYSQLRGTGFRLVPVLNLSRENMPAYEKQYSRWDDAPRYRCFTADTTTLVQRLQLLSWELADYDSFGGICFDDEPGVIAGGCTCERCAQGFRAYYGSDPPKREAYLMTPGVTRETHPVLLWSRYQQDNLHGYFMVLAEAVHSISREIPVYVIPAAPYYSGKHLAQFDMNGKDFLKTDRSVTLDACHIAPYRMYSQFYLSEITYGGWQEVADGLCSMTLPSGLPQFGNVPVYDTCPDNVNGYGAVSAPALQRNVLQTFAEGGRGIVYFPGFSFTDEHVRAAGHVRARYLEPLGELSGALHRPKARVAILYSDSTAAFAEVWRKNPLERYKHLHHCDALA